MMDKAVRMRVSLAILVLLVTVPASAAELAPYLEDQRLGAVVRGVSFPATLRKDLRSGLTNRLLVRITLLADSQTLAQRVVEIAIKYDLWDETFRLTMLVNDAAVLERTYAKIEDVLGFLDNARLPGMLLPGKSAAAQPLRLRAELLLNPIERERMEKIRKWVAENSTPQSPLDLTGMGGGDSASNALFNRIFEQYASGTNVASAWNTTLMSAPFRLQDLAQ